MEPWRLRWSREGSEWSRDDPECCRGGSDGAVDAQMEPCRLRWSGVCLDGAVGAQNGAVEAKNGAVEAYMKLRRLNLAVEGLSTIVADCIYHLKWVRICMKRFELTLPTLKIATSKPASGCLYVL